MQMKAAPIALITGASSGIGRELAYALAKEGYGLILTGRNPNELTITVNELNRKHPELEVIALQAELSTETGVQSLIRTIEAGGYEIELLINNAGSGLHGAVIETDVDAQRALSGIHMIAPWLLTRTYLPAMVKRGSGGVLFVSSVYAFTSAPWQCLYGAAKSWQLAFSLGLREEVRGTGVHITTLCPGSTLSQFRTRIGLEDKSSWFTLSAAQVALAGCRGLRRNQAAVVPGLYYKIYAQVGRLLPLAWLGPFVYFLAYRLRKISVHPNK